MAKKAGVLMPIFSLPGKHYIGDFGKEAYEFIDIIKTANFKIWQILPLNPVGYGNSPYQPYSSYSGDEIYISLERLKDWNLIDDIEIINKHFDRVDYQEARRFKQLYFKEAFENFKNGNIFKGEFENFKKENTWVSVYALFITLKKKNNLICWIDWKDDHKNFIDNKNNIPNEYKDDIEYEIFIQFLFYKQWFELKYYANKSGIEILGDIPIYVGIDSSDVWSNKNCFLLDDKGTPKFIAGVPPDYFSETGQRWGNPIYDWEYLEKNNFDFWIDRLEWNKKIYDIIRIDHFRAFDTYWEIPSSCETAVEGKWVEAPGYALFDTIFKKLYDIKIVVEDLGELREEVLELRDHYNLIGMKIVQFELDLNENKVDFKDKENIILYTGTHDNQTLVGWYKDLKRSERKNLYKKFSKYKEKNVTDKIIHRCFKSTSELVVIPIQDILSYDDTARINTPSTIGSPNWEWKLKDYNLLNKKIGAYRKLIKKTKRD